MEISRLPWTFKPFQECKQTFLLDFLTVPKRQETSFLSYRSKETIRLPSFLTVRMRQANVLLFLLFQGDNQTYFLSYRSKNTNRLPSFLTLPTRLADFLSFLPFQRDKQTPRLSYRSKKTSRLPDCSTAAQETRNEQKCSSRQQYTVYQVYTLDRKINYICIINVYICIINVYICIFYI